MHFPSGAHISGQSAILHHGHIGSNCVPLEGPSSGVRHELIRLLILRNHGLVSNF